MKPGGVSIPSPPVVRVVASDLELRGSLLSMLRGNGVSTRAGAEEAAGSEAAEVVLLDLRELAGPRALYEAIARARAAHDGAEVIGLCCPAQPAGRPGGELDPAMQALGAGACLCLSLPVDPAALLTACAQAAERTRLFRENRRLRADLLALEARAKEREQEWERTLDTLPDAIALCDRSGVVLKGNQALGEMLACGREQMLGRRIDELLRPISLAVGEALSRGGGGVCESTNRGAFGASQSAPPERGPPQGRSYTATLVPVAGPAIGREAFFTVVLLRDVTDERRLQRRLVLGERMAAVGQLAAGLAHEINNPVSFAYSNLQVAKELLDRHRQHGEGLPPPLLQDLAEMLEDCRVGIGRVGDIVGDLRTFTSTEVRGAANEVRLDDIIELALRLTRSEVQTRARLVYDRDLVPLPPIRGDAGTLSHVLMNLLNQALHNLPAAHDGAGAADDQVITVRTRVDPGRGMVELVVADTGPTLSDEMRTHLFEPFPHRRVRLPAAVSAAAGMGLAVAYEVVLRHGGEIEARPGTEHDPLEGRQRGNELIVRLPIAPPAAGDGKL